MADNQTFSAEAYARARDDRRADAKAILAACPKAVRDKVADARRRLGRVDETVAVHKSDDGYTDARAALHQEILGEIFSEASIQAATPTGRPPTFIILGGRGGSGKSWFRGQVYDPAAFIVIDPDQVKARLPEYEGWNAFQVHEESSDIVDAALILARALEVNVVLDVTMKSSGAAQAKVEVFRRDGYVVEAHYMHLPRQVAARRALERFAKPGGRFVPPEVILRNVDNEKTFDLIRSIADRWSFWTNDVPSGDNPQRVAHN